MSSPLARSIANEISQLIAAGDLAGDEHLNTQELADSLGVSRQPVRAALQVLVELGLIEQRVNRGFFVKAVPLGGPVDDPGVDAGGFEATNPYQRLAEDWLTDRIAAEVTELMLRKRYDLSKAQLNDVLLRATREGWAERKKGYGWRFLPVAKTPEAFEQIYRFRMVIEPTAMLEPSFSLDRKVIAELRRVQERTLEGDVDRLPAERILHNGARFHEELVKLSGNPFFHASLVRVNRMRRLLEYRARVDRASVLLQCREHLAILTLLERGDVVEASYAMRRHLGGALSRKSPNAWAWSTGGDSATAAGS